MKKLLVMLLTIVATLSLVAGCTAGQLKQVLPRLQEILANAHNGAQRLERLHSADAHPNKLRRITPRGK